MLVFGFTAMFVAASAAFVAYDLFDRRQQALQAGYTETDNLSHVIEVQALQAIQAAVLTMQHLSAAVRLAPPGATDERLYAQMKHAADQMEHVRALFILDESGVMVHDSDSFPTKRIDFSNREYFTAHRDDPRRGLYIGPPIQSRTTGAYFVALSLRVEKPGGGFGGVIVAALEPEFFQKLYGTIDVGRGGVVALFLADGTLLARAPPIPGTVGKPAPDPGFRERVRSGTARETYEARSGYDGIVRLVSYRAIPGLPLACVVGLERDAVLAEWRSHATKEVLLGVVIALTMLLFAYVVTRQLRHAESLTEAVSESAQRYQHLFRANPLPMWIRNTETQRYHDVNDAAVAAYGYSREEFLALRSDDLVPEADRAEWERYLAGAPREGLLFRAGRHRRKDGSVIDVEVSSRIIDYGGARARLSLVNDVTERRRAEAELRESEGRYRFMFEGNPMPMWVRDARDGSFIAVNDATVALYGYTREEFLRLSGEDIRPESERAAWRAFIERRDPVSRTVMRWRHRRKSGEPIDVEVTSRGFTYEGRPARLALIKDVTEQLRAERALTESAEAIRRLNAELEQRVADRTAQLEATNRELEAFAYSVSHDLRAPLRSIDGFSKALIEDYGTKLDADGRDYLERVRNATHRMSNLIDDLLVLSRVARSEIRSDVVDLGALARDIVGDLRRLEPARDVAVAIQPALRARGDPELLRVLLQNLLENAWKFTSKTPHARIEVGVDPHNGHEEFYVRDNGVGFDMAYAGKLFGAFQRLHAASDFTGTGIGLATVLRIVRRHGGEVRAEAAVDGGATFWFTLGP